MDDQQRAILVFESQWFRHAGAKEQAIRDQFGFSATVYFARLNALLADPEAVVEFPQLVARLRRLRELRVRQRSPRQVA